MSSTKFDKDEVKQAASGRWKEIFESLGIHFELGKHGPCPKCGGKDRFRPFNDFEETGGMICGTAGCDRSFSDGLEAVQWYTDCDFKSAVNKVGAIIGLKNGKQKKKEPIERLELNESLNEMLVPYFLMNNAGISQEGLSRMGARTGCFDGQSVIAFPAWQSLDGQPTNWVIMSATNPKLWHRENNRDVLVRKKTLAKGWGLMGSVAELAAADFVWKVEGPTDCAAFLSQVIGAAVTNIHGAGETPGAAAQLLAGKSVVVCHDGDEAGQRGAAKWIDALNAAGCTVRNLVLPDGYDLRQFLIENGKDALLALAGQAEPVDQAEQEPQPLVEVYSYDRRLVPDDCIDLLTRLQLEVVCQDDEGQVTIYSRATGLVRTVKFAERLQLPNLLLFGGLPCYHQVTDAVDDDDASKFSVREVRRAIGIAGSAKPYSGRVELRGHGIYATGSEIVLCNGSYLSVFTESGQWVKTDRPFYKDLIFNFLGESKNWYSHEQLAELIELAKDPAWCVDWIKRIESYIDRWTFANQKTDPLLLTGLILASFVQQSWTWRPQVSIRGQSNCGKSVFFQFIFGGDSWPGLFNGAALKISSSTAAGIRQKVRVNSVVLGIDEFDQVKRPQEILNLVRTSGRGEKLILGSAHHRAVEFGLTNICWLAGIFVSLDSEADQNRFIEIDMMKPVEPKRSAFQMPTGDEIKAAQMPLLAIAIANGSMASLVARDAYMATKGDEKFLNDRIVENYSVPSAMLAVSTGGGTDDAIKFVELFSVPARRTVDVVSTQDEVLMELLQATIDIGSGAKMNVAEVLNGDPDSVHVPQVGKQVGIAKKTGDSGDFWLVVYPKQAAKYVYKGDSDRKMISHSGLKQVLARIEGAILNRAYVGGIQQRCVLIPFHHVSKLINEPEN